MRTITIALTFVGMLWPAEQAGSIAGTVKVAGTDAPMAGIVVSVHTNAKYRNGAIHMTSATKEVTASTGSDGRYTLWNLPPGPYRLTARTADWSGPRGNRTVTLAAGQELTGVDFSMRVPGSISGRVLDRNGEPIPGITVDLLLRESSNGVAYFRKGRGLTNDLGQYKLGRVEAGQPYILNAWDTRPVPPISETPVDTKLRRPVNASTYFPSSEVPAGAESITLQAGEHREGIDIVMLRGPSLCVTGVTEGPAQYMLSRTDVSGGISRNGGLVGGMPGGKTGPDGKFRLCGLRPGTYRMIAYAMDPFRYCTEQFIVGDRDVEGVRLQPRPGQPLGVSVEWSGAEPDPPLTAKLRLSLRPAQRVSFQGEAMKAAPLFDVPSKSSIEDVLLDEYFVYARIDAEGVYVKDVTYGNRSILHSALQPGSSLDNEVKVVLGRDGGSIAVHVSDKDGKPAAEATVAILPAATATEAALGDTVVLGNTDQMGDYDYGVLAPGKYLVLATRGALDTSALMIGRLWSARSRATEVEVTPNGRAQMKLEPVTVY